MKRKKTAIFLTLGLLVGICVLLYPAISGYWNSRTQSHAITNYESILENLKPEDYTAIFENAQAYNQALYETNYPLMDYKTVPGYFESLSVAGNPMMGYLQIDRINVELPIYHGTSDDVLNIGVGHLQGSSLPIGGENTHSVMSAHRGLPSSKLFTDLDRLEVGDTFRIIILDQMLTYQVDQIKIIEPTDVTDLQIIEGGDYCTLFTCTPYGINTHRLLVRGTRIANATPKLYVTSNAYKIDSLVATPVVAAPILLILLIVLMVKYRDEGSKPLISKEEDEWLKEELGQ